MKFKRIFAAITALAVASAAVLTLTIVSADSRDRVASFDKAKLNDYDLVDYEDMVITDEDEPSEPEPEDTDQGDPAEPTDPADTEEGEVTTPSSEDTEPEEPDPEETGEPEETDDPEVTVPEGEGTEPEETEPDESQPEETDPEESTEPEESQPEENDPEETLKPGDTVIYGDLTLEVLEDGTLSVIGYIGDGEVVIVPEEIDGKAVTAIADGAFADCPALRGAYIPASVTFIGNEAFAWLSDGDEEYQPDEEDQHDFIIFGHLSSYAETYADEKGITFFAVGGVSVTDELWGVEVIFPDGDIGAAALRVTDGYHTGTDTSIYFIVSLLDGTGNVMQPENPVLVKVPVPFGWKDGTVGIYRVGEDGSEEKISSFVEDGYIVFITDHFSEFVMTLDTEEPDDGGDDIPAVTEPEETTTEPEETAPEETTTTTPETTTEPVETTPETTTAPVETTTEDTTPEETTTIEVAAPVESDIEPAESSAEVIETTTAPETAVPEITTAATAPNTTVPPVVTGSSTEEETSGEETSEPEETDQSELPVEAILEVPAINVTVPSSITAIINPYGVPVNINGTEYGATGIASPVYTIINRTTTSGIKVMGTASLTVPVHQDTNEPAIQVVNSPAAVENQRVKSLCAYVLALTSTEQFDVYSTYELPDLFAQGDPRFDDGTLVFTDLTDNPYAEAGTGLIVELDKAESDEKFTYAQFKIAGDITSGDVAMWTSADVINLNLVLDLVPTENEEEAVEVDFDDTVVTVPDNAVTEDRKDIMPNVPEFSFETAPGPVVTITPIDENAPI